MGHGQFGRRKQPRLFGTKTITVVMNRWNLTGMILQIDLLDERKLRVVSFLTRKSVQSNSKVEAAISSKLTFHLHFSLQTSMRRALFILLIFMTWNDSMTWTVMTSAPQVLVFFLNNHTANPYVRFEHSRIFQASFCCFFLPPNMPVKLEISYMV